MIDTTPKATTSEGSRFELATAFLVGLIAIIVAVLVVLEVSVSHVGARADAAAARLASVATTRNNVSQAPFGFQIVLTAGAKRIELHAIMPATLWRPEWVLEAYTTIRACGSSSPLPSCKRGRRWPRCHCSVR